MVKIYIFSKGTSKIFSGRNYGMQLRNENKLDELDKNNENVIIYEEYKTQDEVKELASLSGINFSIYRDYYVSSNYTKETIPQAQVNFYKDSKL